MRVTTQVGHDTKLDLGVVGGEEEAIRKILRKKKFDPNKAEEAQMQKIYGYLGRKGFRYDTVRQVIQNYNDDA